MNVGKNTNKEGFSNIPSCQNIHSDFLYTVTLTFSQIESWRISNPKNSNFDIYGRDGFPNVKCWNQSSTLIEGTLSHKSISFRFILHPNMIKISFKKYQDLKKRGWEWGSIKHFGQDKTCKES